MWSMTFDRRRFLGLGLGLAGVMACQRRGREGEDEMTTPQQHDPGRRQPVLFVGHGSPMNAIDDNAWSRGFRALGAALPAPAAILSVSAHWYVNGTLLTDNEHPETIHDFGGFPRALFEIQYPARGSVDLAKRVVALLEARQARLSSEWGLDHGTWTVLRHIRPAADVPVVQLSIDRRLAPAEHLAIGRALAPLREQGVLVLASGNVTHNLRHAMQSMHTGETATPAWAERFDAEVTAALGERDGERLARIIESEHGRASHPSIDHYLPLLYAAGAATADETARAEEVTFPITGWDLASLSMRSVQFGA
jgi:4,5-DOPA dioxygenase extradiol